jgi:hypothetical protein
MIRWASGAVYAAATGAPGWRFDSSIHQSPRFRRCGRILDESRFQLSSSIRRQRVSSWWRLIRARGTTQHEPGTDPPGDPMAIGRRRIRIEYSQRRGRPRPYYIAHGGIDMRERHWQHLAAVIVGRPELCTLQFEGAPGGSPLVCSSHQRLLSGAPGPTSRRKLNERVSCDCEGSIQLGGAWFESPERRGKS